MTAQVKPRSRNWTLGIVSVALFVTALGVAVLGAGALVALLLPFRALRAAEAAAFVGASEHEHALVEPQRAVLAGGPA